MRAMRPAALPMVLVIGLATSACAPAVHFDRLDAAALMDTLDEGAGPGPGLECRGPEFGGIGVQRWTCAEARDYAWEVVILGESLSEIHAVRASVAHPDAGTGPDSGRSAAFLSMVAQSVRFDGADPLTARDWVTENEHTESAQVELAGATYTLSGGPDEPRVLEIVASD